MGIFGFGKKKEFKRGIEVGAKPFEDKFVQVSGQIHDLKNDISEQVGSITSTTETILNELSNREKKELFGLDSEKILDIFDIDDREFIISMLYTIGEYFETTSDFQKQYLKNLQKYFGVVISNFKIEVSSVENYTDLNVQKYIFQIINEFVYLFDGSFHEIDFDDVIYDYFSLSKRLVKGIRHQITRQSEIVGLGGLVEKYNFVIEKEYFLTEDEIDELSYDFMDWQEKKLFRKLYKIGDIGFTTKKISESIMTYANKISADEVLVMSNFNSTLDDEDPYGFIIGKNSAAFKSSLTSTTIFFEYKEADLFLQNPENDNEFSIYLKNGKKLNIEFNSAEYIFEMFDTIWTGKFSDYLDKSTTAMFSDTNELIEEIDSEFLSNPEFSQIISNSITLHNKFQGRLKVFTKKEGGRNKPIFDDYRPQFHFQTAEVTGSMIFSNGIEMVFPGDNVIFDIVLDQPIDIEKGDTFFFSEDGRTVGSGSVRKIIE